MPNAYLSFGTEYFLRTKGFFLRLSWVFSSFFSYYFIIGCEVQLQDGCKFAMVLAAVEFILFFFLAGSGNLNLPLGMGRFFGGGQSLKRRGINFRIR